MTEQEQRIALCEWFGWKVDYDKPFFSPIEPTTGLRFGFWDTEAEAKNHYADTNSLDVLHEMEMALKDTHGGSSKALDHEPVRYAYELSKIVGIKMRPEQVVSDIKKPDGTPLILNTSVYASPFESIKLVLATAAQRREALLKTLGLWK